MTLVPKQNRVRNKAHLKFVSQLPCILSGRTDTQAAHVSKGRYSMGLKAGDDQVIPLSCSHHSLQHAMGNEERFWHDCGGIESVKELAKALYDNTGNFIICNQLIEKWRKNNLGKYKRYT